MREIRLSGSFKQSLNKFQAASEKRLGIYFGGYSEDISGDFVSFFEEHSELCDEKDGTKGRK